MTCDNAEPLPQRAPHRVVAWVGNPLESLRPILLGSVSSGEGHLPFAERTRGEER